MSITRLVIENSPSAERWAATHFLIFGDDRRSSMPTTVGTSTVSTSLTARSDGLNLVD